MTSKSMKEIYIVTLETNHYDQNLIYQHTGPFLATNPVLGQFTSPLHSSQTSLGLPFLSQNSLVMIGYSLQFT